MHDSLQSLKIKCNKRKKFAKKFNKIYSFLKKTYNELKLFWKSIKEQIKYNEIEYLKLIFIHKCKYTLPNLQFFLKSYFELIVHTNLNCRRNNNMGTIY